MCGRAHAQSSSPFATNPPSVPMTSMQSTSDVRQDNRCPIRASSPAAQAAACSSCLPRVRRAEPRKEATPFRTTPCSPCSSTSSARTRPRTNGLDSTPATNAANTITWSEAPRRCPWSPLWHGACRPLNLISPVFALLTGGPLSGQELPGSALRYFAAWIQISDRPRLRVAASQRPRRVQCRAKHTLSQQGLCLCGCKIRRSLLGKFSPSVQVHRRSNRQSVSGYVGHAAPLEYCNQAQNRRSRDRAGAVSPQ
jgi:hypothetical protein